MARAANNRRAERGVALMIVLLLVASLSFVALSIMERTGLAAARTGNDRARAQSLWRAFGAENLATSAIEATLRSRPDVMSIDDPWMVEPIIVPMEDGAARLFVADATRCFNVNSLSDPTGGEQFRREFSRLIGLIGASEFEGQRLAETITDWIDFDNSREPQGAEDSYYTGLKPPYRTGGAPLADISELRAMRGVTRELYGTLKPYLCAHPEPSPSEINFNMLRAEDAPILAAALGEKVTLAMANDLIAARPPGGYQDIAAFWDQPSLKTIAFEPAERERITLTSRFLRVRAEIVYDTSFLEMTTMFDLSGGDGEVAVIRRRLGAAE